MTTASALETPFDYSSAIQAALVRARAAESDAKRYPHHVSLAYLFAGSSRLWKEVADRGARAGADPALVLAARCMVERDLKESESFWRLARGVHDQRR